jgi:hypothetical protein
LATTSLFFNIIYILLQLPISIYYFLPNYIQLDGFEFSFYLFYLSYSINSYILFISSSLYRKEFILLLKGSIKRLFNTK